MLLIFGIVVVTGLGWKVSVVFAVMNDEEVTRLCRLDEFIECLADVTAGRMGIGFVSIDKEFDVIFGESVMVNQTTIHFLDTVDASVDLRLGSEVVASNQHRLFPHFSINTYNLIIVT